MKRGPDVVVIWENRRRFSRLARLGKHAPARLKVRFPINDEVQLRRRGKRDNIK